MRKTSKIVSLLLTLVMILGIAVPMTVSADNLSFTDVPTTHIYHEAIMNLVAEGVVNGMGDGTYQPEGPVTRAQFAKIICYATGVGELRYSPEEKNIFIDVEPAHWASDNIKTAYNNGIINGMGDGTFAPENPVLYEQAVKMAVCAIGYTQIHAEREVGFSGNAYPTGYLALANKSGLLKGIKDGKQGQPLNRGAVAKLIDNMRDAKQISDGEEIDSIRDQSSSQSKKYEGRVVGLYARSLYTGDDESDANKYQIEIEKGSTRKIFDASDLNLDVDTYLGRSVIVYYSNEGMDDYPSITNISLQSNKNSQVKIDISLIRRYGSDSIEYYESSKSEKTKKINFVSDTKVVYNGLATESSLEEILEDNIENTGTVTLIYSAGGEKADVAFVKSYETFVVTSVDLVNYKAFYSSTGYYVLDVKDRNKNVSIKSAGKDFEFSRIKKNNVISIAESEDGKYVEALVSTKTIAGVVELNDGEAVVLDSSPSSTFYMSNILTDTQEDDLEVGNYVTLYLDAFNRIAKVVLSEKGAYVYGYLSQIALPERRNEQFEVMIYTPGQKGGTVYALAEKVKVDNHSYDSIEEAEDIERLLKISAAATGINPEINGEEPENTTVSQPVRFITNNVGVIQSILTNKAQSSSSNTRLDITKFVTGDGVECIADKTRLGSYKISSSTKIMFIPQDRINGEYQTKTSSYFKKGEFYYAQFAGISNGTIAMIYVYGTTGGGGTGIEGLTEDCKPMVVTDSRSATLDGETVRRVKLTSIVTGESLTVYDGGYEGTEELESLIEGDIVRVAYEEDGDINYATALQIIAVADDVVAGDVDDDMIYYEEGTEEGITAEFRTVLGVVRTIQGESMTVVPGTSLSSGEDPEIHTYVSSAKVYTVDTEYEGNDRINEGSFSEITASSKVLIFTESDMVKAVVLFR